MTWRFVSRSSTCGGSEEPPSSVWWLGPIGAASLTTDLATFILGEATPDSCVLIGHECVLEALTLDGTRGAHLLRIRDVGDGWTCLTDRKEQVRVGISTGSATAPHSRFDRFPSRERYGIFLHCY